MLAVRLVIAAVIVAIVGCGTITPPQPIEPSPPKIAPPKELGPVLPVYEAAALEATVMLYSGAPGHRWVSCSGVHITPLRILTAEHCLKGATEWDGQVWYRHRGDELNDAKPAKMIAANQNADLGLIEAYEPHSVFLELGEIAPGESAFAVGHPQGIAWHLTRGTVLGWLDYVNVESWGAVVITQYAETNVPIKPGNSGGPLVNSKGQLVGICSFYLPTLGLSYFVAWTEVVTFLGRV